MEISFIYQNDKCPLKVLTLGILIKLLTGLSGQININGKVQMCVTIDHAKMCKTL